MYNIISCKFQAWSQVTFERKVQLSALIRTITISNYCQKIKMSKNCLIFYQTAFKFLIVLTISYKIYLVVVYILKLEQVLFFILSKDTK
jgi:hypothetical protein